MTAAANLAAAFVLELLALAALAWWGAEEGGIVLALAAPLAAAVVWGLFAAPKRRFVLGEAARTVAKVVVFAAATAGLVAVGHVDLAIAFAVAVVINLVLLAVLGEPHGLVDARHH